MRIHDVFLRYCSEKPDAEAVLWRDVRWTYANLWDKTLAAKGYLESRNLRPSSKVVLITDTSPEAIAITAACSMLGLVVVPLDVKMPLLRLSGLLQSIEPALVIAGAEANTPELREHISGDLFADFALLESPPSPTTSAIDVDDSSIAYIMFTSGSTGAPKGIMMSHHAACSFFEGLIAVSALGDVRYASSSPFHFDYAWLDIANALGSGATLILADRRLLRKPPKYVAKMAELNVEVFSGVPTIWKMIFAMATDALRGWTSLKRIAFAGEHFPIPLIRALYEAKPGLRVLNIYGQSESIACAIHELPAHLPDDLKYLPIGTGHPNVALKLFKDGQKVSKPFELGELYLKGNILFSGYFNDEAETRRRLVPDPEVPADTMFRSGDYCYLDHQGVFYFTGRVDNQVQVGGSRVELEEIEAVVDRLEEVRNSCVVFLEDIPTPILVAYLAVRLPPDMTDIEFKGRARLHLSEQLPPYMVPQKFELVDEIPVNANGKNDRSRVLELAKAADTQYRTETERLKATAVDCEVNYELG